MPRIVVEEFDAYSSSGTIPTFVQACLHNIISCIADSLSNLQRHLYCIGQIHHCIVCCVSCAASLICSCRHADIVSDDRLYHDTDSRSEVLIDVSSALASGRMAGGELHLLPRFTRCSASDLLTHPINDNRRTS
jgi:hypothetical protein